MTGLASEQGSFERNIKYCDKKREGAEWGLWWSVGGSKGIWHTRVANKEDKKKEKSKLIINHQKKNLREGKISGEKERGLLNAIKAERENLQENHCEGEKLGGLSGKT